MAKFKCYLKDAKSSKPTSIIIVCMWANKQIKLYSGKTIEPQFWNAKERRAKVLKDFQDGRNVNAALDTLEAALKDAFLEMELKLKRLPTKIEFSDVAKSIVNPRKARVLSEGVDFFTFAHAECHKIAQRDMNMGQKSTPSGYVKCHRNTLKVLKDYFGTDRLVKFEDFDMEFHDNFLRFCTVIKNAKPNYIGTLMRNIRNMLNRAQTQNLHKNLSYKRFRRVSETVDTIYLSPDELSKIENIEFAEDEHRLEIARDYFLLGCWTGLRFGDWHQLKGVNPEAAYFTIKTSKTGATTTLPMFEPVKRILMKYQGHFPQKPQDTELNHLLKIIAKMGEINEIIEFSETRGGNTVRRVVPKYEKVTTHTARRSFATNMYNLGLPAYDIMKLTTHKSHGEFMRYIRMTENDSAQKALELIKGKLDL